MISTHISSHNSHDSLGYYRLRTRTAETTGSLPALAFAKAMFRTPSVTEVV